MELSLQILTFGLSCVTSQNVFVTFSNIFICNVIVTFIGDQTIKQIFNIYITYERVIGT